MSQQINLFKKTAHKSAADFSAVHMLQALGAIAFCVILFYAYAVYQSEQLQQQLDSAGKNLGAEQSRLAALSADFSRQRSGMTIEQELKKTAAEAAAQREIINALKNGVIGNTQGYSGYMQAFARQMVNGLWLTGFSIDGDATQMSISGAALSPELVPGYIMRLNNEKIMRGKTFSSLQMQLPKEDVSKPAPRPYLEFVLQSVAAGEADK
jgi:Fimbrial assembly protein (PilN)